MAKPRDAGVQLTEAQKARAYTPQQIGQSLYAKLKDDPNFAIMSLFCTRIGMLFVKRVELLVPYYGSFRDVVISFDNQMWEWDSFDEIILSVKPGYRNEQQRVLSVHVPFTDGTDRVMSGQLKSGTREELLQYLQSPDFGPRLMTVLDDFHVSLSNHD